MARNYVERPALCVGPCRPRHEDGSGGARRTLPGTPLCEVCVERFSADLHHIAEDWDALESRIARDEARGLGDVMVEGSRQSIGISLNEAVIRTRAEVSSWMQFVARIALENPYASHPDDTTTPGLARWIADWHATAITHHHDNDLIAALTTEAREHKRTVRKRAYPSDSRRIDLRSHKCRINVLNEAQQTKPCGGHYYAIVNPAALDRPDLICTESDEHRIPPSQWATKELARPLAQIDGKSWLTAEEAASKVGTNVDNIYNLARRKEWETKPEGRVTRYLEAHVNLTIADRERRLSSVGGRA